MGQLEAQGPVYDSEFELMHVAFVLFREAENGLFPASRPMPGVMISDEAPAGDLLTPDGWKRPLKAAFIVEGLYGDYRVTIENKADCAG